MTSSTDYTSAALAINRPTVVYLVKLSWLTILRDISMLTQQYFSHSFNYIQHQSCVLSAYKGGAGGQDADPGGDGGQWRGSPLPGA